MCPKPHVHFHIPISNDMWKKGGNRGNEGEVRTPAAGHPQAGAEQSLWTEFQGRNNTVPQSAGDSKSGHPQISGSGEQFAVTRVHTHTHTHTDSHTWDFTNPHPRPCLPPHSHTKCILLTSPLSSPHSFSRSVSRELRDPSGDSWKCHPPTPSVRHPHPFDSTFYTHTHSCHVIRLAAAPKAQHVSVHRTPGVRILNAPFPRPVSI